MQPDQITVTITRQGTRIAARTSSQRPVEHPSVAPGQDRGYAHLTVPLRQRGLVCTVEYGLSDYIVHAELPDHSTLIISPPQEPATNHPPGHPDNWLVTRNSPNSTMHEVLYDSTPGGPHAHNAGSTTPLLAAIDARLTQLGLPPREQHTLEPLNAADAVLHRAGFVSVVTHRGRVHRLPAGMTDPVEQRHTVTRATGMLRAGGFSYAVEADLLDDGPPVTADRETALGDQLVSLAQSISRASHSSEAVAGLSQLTAPVDGVLHRITEVLDITAGWWEGLGDEASPLYAATLRRITRQIVVSTQEIQNLRNVLADRHVTRPRVQQTPAAAQEARVTAAQAFSPTAQRTRPAPTPVPAPAPTSPAPTTSQPTHTR